MGWRGRGERACINAGEMLGACTDAEACGERAVTRATRRKRRCAEKRKAPEKSGAELRAPGRRRRGAERGDEPPVVVQDVGEWHPELLLGQKRCVQLLVRRLLIFAEVALRHLYRVRAIRLLARILPLVVGLVDVVEAEDVNLGAPPVAMTKKRFFFWFKI